VNARDAMPEGGSLEVAVEERELAARAFGSELAAGTYVLVTVRDSGVGMSAEVRARLFEPFFTTKGVGQGIGLGLASAYGIVQSCGGHIAVESEPGRGTTVRVWLPRVEPAEPVSEEPPAPVQRGTETVLVVEDEDAVRTVLTRSLGARGYRVLAAATPRAALELVRSTSGDIDLFLLDLVMPEMGGRALARELRALRRGARILFMSGYSAEGEPDGPTHGPLLAKPFSIDELARAVRAALDDHP
jgi:CheY-like chemotaxis protein